MSEERFHGLKLIRNGEGELCFENPVIEFTKNAKSHLYDELSDEEYAKRLDLVQATSSSVFDDISSIPIIKFFRYVITERLMYNADGKSFEEIFEEEWTLFSNVLRNHFFKAYVVDGEGEVKHMNMLEVFSDLENALEVVTE